jgi:glucose-6-phosphate 1-epimerase
MKISHTRLGAQVLAIENVFYLSPMTMDFQGPRRGGVPIIFPQFANKGFLTKHGFARNCQWQMKLEECDGYGRLFYTKNILSDDFPGWPHEAALEIQVVAIDKEIRIEMVVLNTGPTEFSWTGGLHPYFRVDNLMETWVEGFKMDYSSCEHSQSQFERGKDYFTFTDFGCEVLFLAHSKLKLITLSKTIDIESEGFEEWMIWNPGKDGALRIADLPDDDWQRFVCIEPVSVTTPIRLDVGQKFKGALKISF